MAAWSRTRQSGFWSTCDNSISPLEMELREKAAQLPLLPGVYLYKDQYGEVIYVGKAKNLRARVRSYFNDDRLADVKTGSLIADARDVEIFARCGGKLGCVVHAACLCHQPSTADSNAARAASCDTASNASARNARTSIERASASGMPRLRR